MSLDSQVHVPSRSSIEQSFARPAKKRRVPIVKLRADLVQQSLVRWIVGANMPFTAVEHPVFGKLLGLLNVNGADSTVWRHRTQVAARDLQREKADYSKGAVDANEIKDTLSHSTCGLPLTSLYHGCLS